MGRRKTGGGITGVEPRATSIRISFTWQGTFFRETVPLAPTPANLKHAARLKANVDRAITSGAFSFAEYFPKSKHAPKAAEPDTFRVYAKRYLASITDLAEGTQREYGLRLARWTAALGDTLIPNLRYSQIEALIGEMAYASNGTRNNALIPLRGVLGMAVEDGVIAVSPAMRVRTAAVQQKQPDPFSLPEVDQILGYMSAVYPLQVWAYFAFAMYTGARPEELVELKWSDVDWEHSTINISRARSRGGAVKATKTYQVRDVELVSRAVEALRVAQQHPLDGDDHIFWSPVTGCPWHTEAPLRRTYWYPMIKALGLRKRTPYHCRHTYATMHIMAGAAPSWIADQLGHKSLAMLLNVYAKWLSRADHGREKAKLEAVLAVAAAAAAASTAASSTATVITHLSPPSGGSAPEGQQTGAGAQLA
jgi:integrase